MRGEDERDLGDGGYGAVLVPGVDCRDGGGLVTLYMIYNAIQLRSEILSQSLYQSWCTSWWSAGAGSLGPSSSWWAVVRFWHNTGLGGGWVPGVELNIESSLLSILTGGGDTDRSHWARLPLWRWGGRGTVPGSSHTDTLPQTPGSQTSGRSSSQSCRPTEK